VFAVNPPIGDPPLQGALSATELVADFTSFLEGEVFRQVQGDWDRVRQQIQNFAPVAREGRPGTLIPLPYHHSA
jgi:hypothetical protein